MCELGRYREQLEGQLSDGDGLRVLNSCGFEIDLHSLARLGERRMTGE